MSRYPDEYEDRGGRDDDGYDDRRGGRDDDAVVERARAKVATPGLLLILTGLVALLLEVGLLVLIFTAPTAFYDFMVDFTKKNVPPGEQQQKQLDDLKAQEAQMRFDSPLNIGSAVLGLLVNLATVVGGIKMRSLSGYPLAMVGAVAGIIPLGGCCCLTLPVGIWALVVLMNEDVKTAFARGGAPRGEY
jgi:hypothetical protein